MAVPAVLIKKYGVQSFLKEIVDDFVKNSSILVWDAFKKEETTIKIEFYGLLADLEAKHHMSNMKVNFSSIKHWSILCDSQREEEQSAPIDQMKKCQLKNMAVWKVSSPSELDKIYEAHGLSHLFQFETCDIHAIGLPDFGHTLLAGCFQEHNERLFLSNIKNKDQSKNQERRIYSSDECVLIQHLTSLIYPQTWHAMNVNNPPERLGKFIMAEILHWMRIGPIILSQIPNKPCKCKPFQQFKTSRPLSLSIRKHFKLSQEHMRNDHIVFICRFSEIALKYFQKDGAPTRDIEKDQLELEMIMKLGKELSGFWTLKCHLTAYHLLKEIGNKISSLVDSNTLVPEQDNKLWKQVPHNSVAPAFFIMKRIHMIKSIKMAREDATCISHFFPVNYTRAPVHISQAQLQNLCKTYDMYKFPRSGEPKAFICPFNKGQWPGFELRTGDFVQLHPNGIFPPRLLNILISF